MTIKKKHSSKAPIKTLAPGEKQPRKRANKDVALQPLEEKIGADFPIIGIGASAGGLAAFEAFFSAIPSGTEPGMAFVLVQHLTPDHKSILVDLIRSYTHMLVFEVTDGMAVQANCVYIIPPGRDMAFFGGRLQLLDPVVPRGHRQSIDFFFRSLAKELGARAICIILSGTGYDGTEGLRAVKGEGGMIMVQHPDSAEFNGMPLSAIGTGLTDYQLLPAEMPAQILDYVAHTLHPALTATAGQDYLGEAALQKIFVLLRTQSGHDFSKYKPGTIRRRIERRLAVHHLTTLDNYLNHIQKNPAEIEALFRDLLIGVTSFFRDPLAFKALEEKVIPRLFAGKPADGVIRVWSTGCSTGEEAYSLAILLQESMERFKNNLKVLIFATDIDSQAIATARTGIYPTNIADKITPDRLARFFTLEPDGSSYRIHKKIRELLIFSEQNVIKDPPFSKLDLISCRNLLIYLGADLQKKLMPLFHYALNPGGFLFLGSSESVNDFSHFFSTLDGKLKLYSREADVYGAQHTSFGRFISTPLAARHKVLAPGAGKIVDTGKLSLRELTEQALLRQIAPTGALVKSNGDILYLHGRTGMYLEPAQGETTVNNILNMAREGLRRELTIGLNKAVTGRKVVMHPGLLVRTNGDFTAVNLTICPLTSRSVPVCDAQDQKNESADPAASMLFLVILEEALAFNVNNGDDPARTDGVGKEADAEDTVGPRENARIATLKQELWAQEEYLQTANEEFKSTNEEMQSVNEELQSTNEELETSREEMQSINEELATVNCELQNKVADLSRANNDMNNLLSGTGIATIFLDNNLHILRFTPNSTGIINLILTDLGRPLSHLVSNLLGYEGLEDDTRTVLDTLVPKEIEVQVKDGSWYILRIRPYRTLDNIIEGVVLTFVDITATKRAQEALLQANDQLRLAVAGRKSKNILPGQNLDPGLAPCRKEDV